MPFHAMKQAKRLRPNRCLCCLRCWMTIPDFWSSCADSRLSKRQPESRKSVFRLPFWILPLLSVFRASAYLLSKQFIAGKNGRLSTVSVDKCAVSAVYRYLFASGGQSSRLTIWGLEGDDGIVCCVSALPLPDVAALSGFCACGVSLSLRSFTCRRQNTLMFA